MRCCPILLRVFLIFLINVILPLCNTGGCHLPPLKPDFLLALAFAVLVVLAVMVSDFASPSVLLYSYVYVFMCVSPYSVVIYTYDTIHTERLVLLHFSAYFSR